MFGYEEALGYCVAPDVVRDKDGISAALLVAELAAALKAAGPHARWTGWTSWPPSTACTRPTSSRCGSTTSPVIADMARLRADPPDQLLGQPVEVGDLLPEADVLRWTPRGRVVVRPSGTEPKLKAYLEIVVPDGSRAVAEERLAQLRSEVSDLLGQPDE